MDKSNYTTNPEIRKGSHLTDYERGEIKALLREGYSCRKIAAKLGRSHQTIINAVKKGTPERKGDRGRKPGYSAELGAKVYEENRKRSKKKHAIERCQEFVRWVVERFVEDKWSLDACVGYARRNHLFKPGEMVCTKTLYNEVWAGNIPEILPIDLPDALSRKPRRARLVPNKRVYGRSIEERPPEASRREEVGHWELDTVIGKRGSEPVVMTLLEKRTEHYIAMKIASKTPEAVMGAMDVLREAFGNQFNEVFKTVTADNGTEFSRLSELERYGTRVYFAHPYTSCERPQNERHNGLLRRYIPKGKSIERFSEAQILGFADTLNELPRRRLGYQTPAKLFDEFLDEVYSTG